MAKQPGQFIITSEQTNHSFRDIDSFGAGSERFCSRKINQDDANSRLFAREMSKNTSRDRVEVDCRLLVLSDVIIGFHQLCFDIAKCPFLLSAKNLSGGWNPRQANRTLL